MAASKQSNSPATGNGCLERVLDVPFHCWSPAEVIEAMDRHIRGPRTPQYIAITNTESMYYARRLADHGEYVDRAAFSFCDGIGIVLGARLHGRAITRLNGPFLMDICCREGIARKWRHFFCGGKPGVADMLARKLTDKNPGLITAGTYCPPFRALTPDDENQMLDQINESQPDILWVGLGLLKQERFIQQYLPHLRVPWSSGVGAAFDYHAGTARWAPPLLRRIGLEWLYRLCFEPRMFKRNVRSFILLGELILSAALPGRRSKKITLPTE